MKNFYQTINLKWTIILVLGAFNFSIAQTKVIAYVPNWIDLNTFSNSIQYGKLTHINIAFENPDANGYLSFQAGNNTIIQAAHSKNVKVFVSLGGGSVSEGGAIRDYYFNLITSGNRASFIQKIVDYVNAHNFDGVDMDLEGPAINGDYGNFIIDLATRLHANNKLLSAALSEGYGGANVPSFTFSAFDWINIMAYDATGPWAPNSPGQHSPYSMAVNQFNYWTGRGLAASKAIIGVPFYGYGFGSAANQGISYSDIVNTYPGAENSDQVGSTIYYNGIPTIKQKTTFALQNAGGVMIWQLAQDAVGSKSLLTAINEVVTANQPPSVNPSTDVITVYKDCNYTGFSGGLTIGDYNLARLKTLGVQDDAISSLRITQGFQAVLYQDDNFGGASTVINSDNTCLNTTWNDKVTSIRIIANGANNLGNTTYFLQNRNSGMNMDVWGASTANGANVAQGTANTGNNQKFTLTHLGDGLYKIIVNHSGQSLDVNNFNKANGANVEQYPYNATTNQQFVLVSTGDGFYKIIARHSGKVVEVAGASTVNGANVQQWDNNNQTCGQWKLVPVTITPVSTLIQAESYSAMSGIQTEATTDTDGGLNVGYADTGDWMAYYNINFPTTGSYLIEYRVASAVNGSKISSDLNAGSIQLGSLDVPNTGGWQNWQTISQTVNVNAGTYNFGVFIQNTGLNLNWIKITKVGAGLTAKVASSDTLLEENTSNTLNVYPNPVENTLFFTTDVTGGTATIVNSQTGASISKEKISNNSLDVSNLKTGVYLIIFDKDGTKTVKRFIKK
jgi:GH18 family chitinase